MHTPHAHAWQVMYPPLACHAHGWLDVGDGHQVYWEECGHPAGLPALFVHGGPGAGCSADDRRWFDPLRWRIVLFDQRGAGRSRPRGWLHANRTADLVRDIEALRRHRGIERWALFGGSWGVTLALAYAQRHAERVLALVLRGVFTATAAERAWLHGGPGRDAGAAALQPQAWRNLGAALGGGGHTGASLPQAFERVLHGSDQPAAQVAARAWLQWEQELMSGELPGPEAEPAPGRLAGAMAPRGLGDAAALSIARIGVHYARQAYFLDEGALLADAAALRDVPGVIVQGLRDRVTPPQAAHALHRAWAGSTLELIDSAGHASSHPEMARRLIAATDHFATAERRGAAAPADAAARRGIPPPLSRSTHGPDHLHR